MFNTFRAGEMPFTVSNLTYFVTASLTLSASHLPGQHPFGWFLIKVEMIFYDTFVSARMDPLLSTKTSVRLVSSRQVTDDGGAGCRTVVFHTWNNQGWNPRTLHSRVHRSWWRSSLFIPLTLFIIFKLFFFY